MHTENDDINQSEAAIARRLAKLQSLPVDTTGLEHALRSKLPPAPQIARRLPWPRLLALAASVLILTTLSLAFLQSREVEASPVLMAQMYHDMVAGRVPTMHATSLAEVNHAIAAFSGNFPNLPDAPAGHMMACCMRNVGNKKVACVLLDNGGTPVTMVVANASEVQPPNSPTVTKDGATYHVQHTGELNMVRTERDNRWICLISPLPQDQLIDVARGIHF
jgi:hypothetical protein